MTLNKAWLLVPNGGGLSILKTADFHTQRFLGLTKNC